MAVPVVRGAAHRLGISIRPLTAGNDDMAKDAQDDLPVLTGKRQTNGPYAEPGDEHCTESVVTGES